MTPCYILPRRVRHVHGYFAKIFETRGGVGGNPTIEVLAKKILDEHRRR